MGLWKSETEGRRKAECPTIRFERYADDVVCHCGSQRQAEELRSRSKRRLEECGLELHPKKTKIVYCKTATRKGVYPEWVFTFLGYAFGPRIARKAGGELWLSFGPAISAAAAKQIRQTIRGWRLRRRPRSSIEDLAFWINPVLRGWIQ